VRRVRQSARVVGVIVIALGAASATVALGSQGSSLKGGTYRVGWEASYDGTTDDMDPTGESDPRVLGILSNLLVRTLVGYNHVGGPAGRRLVADLATTVPAPTDGGRTYAFTLKRGIRFGPPVNRRIDSGDIRYAIERLARPRNRAQYASVFRVIRGFDAYRAGRAQSIAGIETPNARTIVFRLTRPVGEFPHRLTLPATAPIPPEVGKCFEGRPGKYGADLVSSGPYMYEGSDRVRIGSCAAITPARGNGYPLVTLVRNPRYDPRTDSTAARESNPDRFVFLVVSGRPAAAEVYGRLAAGDLDDAILSSGPKVLGRYADAARKRGVLRVNSTDWLFYLSFNLTHPPFDDVHVRRALSWAVDRAALRDTWGGALAGTIPGHLIPDELLGGRLSGFDPFATPGNHGDTAKARAEMGRSKYATKQGRCVASACRHVWVNLFCEADRICHDIEYAASQRMILVLRAAGNRIGIQLEARKKNRADIRIPSTYRYIPLSGAGYWHGLYPEASAYVDPVFAGWAIAPSSNPNTSLVGITLGQAKALDTGGSVHGVPTVDADIARCSALAGDRRLDCYAALDRKLSTEIVPWIPFLLRKRITILGPQVAKWEFDASRGTTAWAHVAVKR
jgi:ABC-type transport system substrate-binding protein